MLITAIEWLVWSITLLVGVWFSIGIRRTAVRRIATPTWPTIIISLVLVTIPVIFIFIPFSKLHIIWMLVVMWPLSLVAGVAYIPLVSQLLIWPAYFYSLILTVGTGVSISSPSKRSPWAARR